MLPSTHIQSNAATALMLCALGLAACAEGKGIEPVPKLDVLQVLPASGSLEVGGSASVGALRLQGGASTNVTSTVEWKSDDENVVTVSYDPEAGAVVEAMGVGMATISANDGDVSASAEFVVVPSIVGVELDKGLIELAKGTTLPLGAVLLDSRGAKVAYDDTGAWGSSEPAIAEVDPAGVVRGIEVGETLITLTRDGIAASQRVFVRDWMLESIEATPVTGTTLPFGQSSPIRVVGSFSGGHTQEVTALFLLGLDLPDDAAADAEPVLTLEDAAVTAGTSEGMARVTGTGREGTVAAGQDFSLEFSVIDEPLASLAIELPPIVAVGGEPAVASITGTYGELEFETAATLSAEPAELVSIDNSRAAIAAIAPGRVEITATVVVADDDADPDNDRMLTATGAIEVVEAEVESLAIAFASEDDAASVAAGGSTSLRATARYGSAPPLDVTDQAVWSSDDEVIAVVSNVRSGTVTGLAPGSATITARYRGAAAQFEIAVGAAP